MMNSWNTLKNFVSMGKEERTGGFNRCVTQVMDM